MKTALLLTLLLCGCAYPRKNYHKEYYRDDVHGTGLFIFWMESKPVSNRYGVCGGVYSLHTNGWGGENHRLDAPWDQATKSHVGFARFKNQADAEEWGDALCK